MGKKNKKLFLIYDKSCPFCHFVARNVEWFIGKDVIDIIPNTSKRIYGLHRGVKKNRVKKDVHVVHIIGRKRLLYSGSDAIAYTLSRKRLCGYLWPINRKIPQIFRSLYYILKKIRKVVVYLIN